MLVFWLIMAVLWTSLFDVLPSGFYDKFPIDTADATEETAFAEQHRLACDRRAATANVFYYFVPLLACALVFEYIRLHTVLHSMLLLLTFLLALMFLQHVIKGRILEHKQHQWTLWGLEATASIIQSRVDAKVQDTPLLSPIKDAVRTIQATSSAAASPTSCDDANKSTSGAPTTYGAIEITIAA